MAAKKKPPAPARKLGRKTKPKAKRVQATEKDLRLATSGDSSVTRRPGRPPRAFDPAVAAEIVDRAQQGMPLKTATLGRASFDVVLRWMGENEEFACLLQKADADEQVRLLAAMETAPAGRWQVFAWKLERMWPHIYGQRAELRVENTHKFEVDRNVCDQIAASWKKFEQSRKAPSPTVEQAPIDV